MKLLPQTALTATALAVAAAFSLPAQADTPNCSFKSGKECDLSKKNYTLSGHYQNGALSREELEKMEAEKYKAGSRFVDALFSIFGQATVSAEPNTTFTVDNTFSDYEVFSVLDSTLTLPAGTKITVNPNFKETVTDKQTLIDDHDYHGTTAVFTRDAVVNSQADVFINSLAGEAYNANPGSTLNLGGNITLNNISNTALQAHVDSVIHFNNGTINATDKADFSTALHVSEGAKINLNNSRVQMANPNSVLGILSGGTISLTDSQAETAGTGILHFDHYFDEYEIKTTALDINLKNSTFGGQTALAAVNPKDDSWRKFSYFDNAAVTQPFKINFNAVSGSTLKGAVELNASDKISDANQTQVNINLDDSTWIYDKSSTISNLTAKQGKVVSDVSDGLFNTLTINGNLSGNAHFTLNTDLAAQQGDKVVVKGQTEGAHTITVQNSKSEPKSSGGRLNLVETQGGSGTFALTNNNGKNYVDAGAFRYDFKKEGNNWVLANTTPAQPVGPAAPTEPEKRTLSNYTNTPLGYVQAASTLVQQGNASVGQRQSALHLDRQGRLNGLWVQGGHSRSTHDAQDVGNRARSAGFKMRNHGFQIGYDRSVGQGYVGVLAGHGESSLDYSGDYVSTDLTHDSVGLYGGMDFNQGWFADGTFRYSRFKAETGDENARFYARSLSVQGGKNIALNAVWSLVPQAGVSLTRLSGANGGRSATLLHGRVGADVQAAYALANGIRLQPALGVYYLGDYKRVDFDFNGYRFAAPNNGHRAAVRAGIGAALSAASHLNVSVETEHGKHYRRPFAAEVGYRHQW